jgi:translation initiation factor IF-2
MAEVTVKELAEIVGTDVKKLVIQLKEAGVTVKKGDDVVTDEQKSLLLGFLKKSHGEEESSEPKRITLKRKQKSTLKISGGHGRNKTVSVEVRKKRTYVKRSDLVAKEQEEKDRLDAIRDAELAAIKATEDKKAAELAAIEAENAKATEETTDLATEEVTAEDSVVDAAVVAAKKAAAEALAAEEALQAAMNAQADASAEEAAKTDKTTPDTRRKKKKKGRK